MGEPEVAVAAAVLGSWLGATTNLNVVREVEIVRLECEACSDIECPIAQWDLERCPVAPAPPVPEGSWRQWVHQQSLADGQVLELSLGGLAVGVLAVQQAVSRVCCRARCRHGGRRGRTVYPDPRQD